MDHKEPSLFQTRATYLLEVYSRSLQETTISSIIASSLTEIFLKKSLFALGLLARQENMCNLELQKW